MRSRTSIATAVLAACSSSPVVAPSPSAEHIAKAMGISHYTAYTARTDPNQLLGR